MSNWFADKVGGLVGDAYYYFGGGQEAEDTGKALDAKLAALNAQKYANGGYTDAAYQQVLADQSSGATGDVQSQLEESGAQGANEGLDALEKKAGEATGSVWDIITKFIKEQLKNIPWWVYVGGLVAVFFYLGGAGLVRAWLKKKTA